MPAPYPVWFREKVVAAWLAGEGSFASLAERFGIGEATVNRWVSRLRRTGDVSPDPMGGARHPMLVDDAGLQFIRRILVEVPDTTLVELCEAYRSDVGVEVAPQRMSDAVARLGFTRKRGFSGRWRHSEPTSSRRARTSSKPNLG